MLQDITGRSVETAKKVEIRKAIFRQYLHTCTPLPYIREYIHIIASASTVQRTRQCV